jgi:hypothetical protein
MKKARQYFNKSLKTKNPQVFLQYLNTDNLPKDIISVIIQILASAIKIYLTISGNQ